MDRHTRLALMAEALGSLAHSGRPGDFVIFEDKKTSDYVQLMVMPFVNAPESRHARLPLTGDWSIPKAQWEVTDRGLHGSTPLPGTSPLSPAQIEAIEAEGFRPSNNPNFAVYIDLVDIGAIAAECERLFEILRSSAGFELGVSMDG